MYTYVYIYIYITYILIHIIYCILVYIYIYYTHTHPVVFSKQDIPDFGCGSKIGVPSDPPFFFSSPGPSRGARGPSLEVEAGAMKQERNHYG